MDLTPDSISTATMVGSISWRKAQESLFPDTHAGMVSQLPKETETPTGWWDVYFVVRNDALEDLELTAQLGVVADITKNRGDPTGSPGPRKFEDSSVWRVNSHAHPNAHAEIHLNSLWERIGSLADRIVALPGNSLVYLGVHHEINAGAEDGLGFHLSREWTKFLGETGATVDIDQYLNDPEYFESRWVMP